MALLAPLRQIVLQDLQLLLPPGSPALPNAPGTDAKKLVADLHLNLPAIMGIGLTLTPDIQAQLISPLVTPAQAAALAPTLATLYSTPGGASVDTRNAVTVGDCVSAALLAIARGKMVDILNHLQRPPVPPLKNDAGTDALDLTGPPIGFGPVARQIFVKELSEFSRATGGKSFAAPAANTIGDYAKALGAVLA